MLTAEGDAFVGDLFVNYTVLSKPLYLSDPAAWEKSYERIRTLEPRTVYVCHGEAPAELGDKTQLDVMIMTAKHKMPIWIFVEATLGLAAIKALGVLAAGLPARFIPEMILRKAAAVLFVVIYLPM